MEKQEVKAAPTPKVSTKPQPAAKPATKVTKPAAAPAKATAPVKGKQPEAKKESGLTAGKYKLGSKGFLAKFPEMKALQERLEKLGYTNFRFEITCSPKTSPSKKVVNVTKHNAPSDWL